MTEWIQEILKHLVEHPWLQGLIAGFCTLILEDPTTITCWLRMGG